jgi:hypothetical protein
VLQDVILLLIGILYQCTAVPRNLGSTRTSSGFLIAQLLRATSTKHLLVSKCPEKASKTASIIGVLVLQLHSKEREGYLPISIFLQTPLLTAFTHQLFPLPDCPK